MVRSSMRRSMGSQLRKRSKLSQLSLPLVSSAGLLLTATPVLAHHAMAGRLPANFVEGFLSGLAHPVIGLDHLAFVVAVGLLAATEPRGIVIPIAFILTAMLGTGLHLISVPLPAVELLVSGSILLFGSLLVRQTKLSLPMVTGLAALAGLFHGYAYGESIFGAEMTPLLSYLIGFTAIQLLIALSAFWVGRRLLRQPGRESANLRSAGLVICGIGIAFFASQVVATVLPV
ncbi:MAG: HupE/UreJ family protein [Leptolyngbya sp. IPPAS B-1204]